MSLSKARHPGILTPGVENANQNQRARPFGLVEGAIARLVGQEVEVMRAESVGPRYRIVTLQGPGLRDKRWRPGHAFQILFAGWQSREYTPYLWSEDGALSFLAYLHAGAGGVAADWLGSVAVGERCHVFGPRWALDLTVLPRPLVLFGDETSLGTAASALCTTEQTRGLECLFEVDDVEAARAALDATGFRGGDVTFLERGASAGAHAHLDVVRERFRDDERHGVFTGNATSIKYLYGALRRDGVSSKRLKNKAYWAAGKRGLE